MIQTMRLSIHLLLAATMVMAMSETILPASTEQAPAGQFSYVEYDRLVAKYVDARGRVNYAGLKQELDVAPAQTLVRTSQMWGTEKTEGQVGAAVGRLLKVRSSSSASLKVARSCYTRSRPSIYEWPSVKESILDALRASKKK